MTSIIAASQPQGAGPDTYRACLETDPGCYGSGATVSAATGNLVRCNFGELDLEDRDLQVELGVHWDEMTDSQLGCLVQQRGLFTVDVKSCLPTK